MPSIEMEKLFINDIQVVSRDKDGIFFKGDKTVKLSQKNSVISLLKEEDIIFSIYSSFSKILFEDFYNKDRNGMLGILLSNELEPNDSQYSNLDRIRNSGEKLSKKLHLTFLNAPKDFEYIKNSFIEIFPYVEDIKIEPIEVLWGNAPRSIKGMPFIQIKERGIENWVNEIQFSSGMYRTLMHIAELYLCADGTVILIDEFENSLGINCIDEITRSIITEKRDLQFIITSHHPYIINNINIENWKLITRKSGVVKNRNTSQLNIGKSKHEAFIQLVNLDAYVEGVEL